MRLLLDTHALLWFCDGHPALSTTARGAMEDTANECYVSFATPWEVAIKVSLGKLDLQVGFEALFPGAMNANGFKFLPSSPEHFRALIPLALHHGDPFDRLLIAQAHVERLTIITCDSQFPAYGVPLLW